ncbi:unnamed protein product [Closterium sp. Naga37s-1]|nr:unnamed protein product [Closterium sp. Naga37s-1]
MQSEVGSTELRFVLRRFPLIRTLRIRLFGPTVLPGAPREERAADDRHHKRTGWGRGGGVSAEGWGGGTGIGGGGAQQGLLDYMRHVVATWGRNIRHIEMHDPLPSSDEFWRCVEGHPMLSKVTVYKCTYLTDRFLGYVARCGGLKELSIGSCPNVSGGGFAELAEKCPGLEEIVLEDLTLSVVAKKARSAPGGGRAGAGGAGEGVGEGAGEVEGRADEAMGANEAERWDGAAGANGADGWDGAVRESGEAEAAVVQAGAEGGTGAAAEGRGGNLAASFPNLSSLKIVNCTLDAHWLEMFAGQLPALRRLTIMACPDPLDRFFFTAARTAAWLESVEIVDCEGVSDNCIVALLKSCPAINSLTLSGCEGGSGGPGGGGGGGEGGGMGGGMGGGGGDVNGGMTRVTDESLRAVVVHGVGLRSLQLKWSPGFTGHQLARDVLDSRRWSTSFEGTTEAELGQDGLARDGLARDGLARDGLTLGWSGVESLQLEGLDGLSDSFLLLAAATCPRLSTLAVEYCREISEAGLIPLVKSCHSLQHMCFSGFRASHLSDLLLHTIASHCTLLSTLTLRACNGVTTQGVTHALHGCEKIARCHLARCPNVDEERVVGVAREVGEVRAKITTGRRRTVGVPVIEVS